MRESDPLLGQANGHARGHPRDSGWTRLKERLGESVDVSKCGPALALQCAIAGAADVASYSRTKTWAAFMTGNITQLSMSATTLLLTRPLPTESVMRLAQSSSAVLGFVSGCYLASLVDGRFHSQHRGKLVIFALVRSIAFALVALTVGFWGWHSYVGMATLFVLAANMGTMAVNAVRLGSTPYSTTVVFTATMASLFSDPALPYSLSTASKTRGKSIICLVLGGALSQAISTLISKEQGDEADPERQRLASACMIAVVALADVVSAILWLQINKTDVR